MTQPWYTYTKAEWDAACVDACKRGTVAARAALKAGVDAASEPDLTDAPKSREEDGESDL